MLTYGRLILPSSFKRVILSYHENILLISLTSIFTCSSSLSLWIHIEESDQQRAVCYFDGLRADICHDFNSFVGTHPFAHKRANKIVGLHAKDEEDGSDGSGGKPLNLIYKPAKVKN